ncbi:hypothetical protein OG906_02320 [Streptomyces sp. NBC_01426]|uniref:hypothetical protein n=1 Tax=unclassified Streptomyces TaxID=2593676 RepID=UPI002E37A829|nr:hypothetical protein [Streptomyces sp. NBC_01426]
MPNDNEIPAGRSGPDEDEWNDFVRRVEAEDPARQPSSGAGLAPRPRRVWPLNLGLALLAAGAAFGVLKYTTGSPEDGGTVSAPAASAPAKSAAVAPSAAPSAVPSAVPSRGNAVAAAGARPMMPLAELFPAKVKGGPGTTFTRVGSVVMESCTEPAGVGHRLAAMIDDSAGCVGEQTALYKDDRENQFTLAVFTMKDPRDTLRMVSELAMAFDDYQVAVQVPPAGSGLATLPADSGLVQGFVGNGRVMLVAMGQWSDGRTADFQSLVDRMQPLQDEVSRKIGAHEQAG